MKNRNSRALILEKSPMCSLSINSTPTRHVRIPTAGAYTVTSPIYRVWKRRVSSQLDAIAARGMGFPNP